MAWGHLIWYAWVPVTIIISKVSSTGGLRGHRPPLLKNKFLKILGKGCSID